MIDARTSDGIATLTLQRGKVNAINEELIDALRNTFDSMRANDDVRAIVLTGNGPFFSFGFDVPEVYAWPKERFTDFVRAFCDLYRDLFAYPKPVIAALNGHAVAGGCMLALACDRRIMIRSGAKIALNEIRFGSSVFAGSVEMLRFAAGSACATDVLYSGHMYSADEAAAIGLVEAVDAEQFNDAVASAASDLASRDAAAFASMKSLLREPVAGEMRRLEERSIAPFVEIWYSPSTREKLKSIVIR